MTDGERPPTARVGFGYFPPGVWVKDRCWWLVVLASTGWEVDGVALPRAAVADAPAPTRIALYHRVHFSQRELLFPASLGAAGAAALIDRAEREWLAAVLEGTLPDPYSARVVETGENGTGPAPSPEGAVDSAPRGSRAPHPTLEEASMSGSGQQGQQGQQGQGQQSQQPQAGQPQLLAFVDKTTSRTVACVPITEQNLAQYAQGQQTAGMTQPLQPGAWVIVPQGFQLAQGQPGQALLAQPGVQILPHQEFQQRYQPADDIAASALAQQGQQTQSGQQTQGRQSGQARGPGTQR